MIKLVNYQIQEETEPHAIIYRKLEYFSNIVSEGVDDLDYFRYITFVKDNENTFDLRTYKGDLSFIVSIYLPASIDSSGYIIELVDKIIADFALPKSAIGWKRDWQFDFGVLKRPPKDRLKEAEARLLALKVASTMPGRTATMEFIKENITRFFEPSALDLRPSGSRSGEPVYKQIVGNIVSHSTSRRSIFTRGYASMTADGIHVTDTGMDYLKSVGFLSSM